MNSAHRQIEIVNAAFDCIAATGHLSLSTTELAYRVGISQPAIFRHFRSKQQLHQAILDEANRRVIEELKLLIGHSELWNNPLNLLQDVISKMGGSFERSPGVWLTLLCQRSLAAEAEMPVEAHKPVSGKCAITQLSFALDRLGNASMENGQLDMSINSAELSHILTSLLFGMGQLWLNGERDFSLPGRLDRAVKGIIVGHQTDLDQRAVMPISAIA